MEWAEGNLMGPILPLGIVYLHHFALIIFTISVINARNLGAVKCLHLNHHKSLILYLLFILLVPINSSFEVIAMMKGVLPYNWLV